MILHLDMDAFFASVEQRDNPSLKGKPVIVSGHSKRSVVSTASYEARKFGIHSAMPVFKARQLCPNLIILPGSRHKYATDSKRIMSILNQFSPLVEPVSIDEAFIDINGCESLFGSPEKMAGRIKQKIFSQLSLTCSIGIAPVRFMAKIASDMKKPDGLTIIEPQAMDKVITRLPIEKVPGVGKQAMAQMQALNIRYLGDIRQYDPHLLNKKFGKMGNRLAELSLGIDKTPIETGSVRKSISSETTLANDISNPSEIGQIILAHSQRVGRDLRKKEWFCRHVSIKIKFSDFTQITRGKKTKMWINSSKNIYQEAMILFSRLVLKKKIRLIGVGVSDFRDKTEPVQMSLLPDPDEISEQQWGSVDQAVDSIWNKFGSDVIQKASLKPLKRNQNGGIMETKTVKVNIRGRVQGVFFRAFTRDEAVLRQLTGYVRNCSDGSVEALFQGATQQVDDMLSWCWQGSPHSKVDGVTSNQSEFQRDISDFQIRY